VVCSASHHFTRALVRRKRVGSAGGRGAGSEGGGGCHGGGVCGGRGGEEAGGEEACEFDAVLVDPPRAGLDLDTLRY